MLDYSAFETSKWEKMSHPERVEALQGLENTLAAEQGRTPRKVHPSNDLSTSTRGQYSPADPDYLRVNSNLIASNNGNYQAMQTTIHEGRHAYQDDCVTGSPTPLPQDVDKVESWSHNMPGRGGVYNGDCIVFADYRYQPVEKDANNYAKDKVNSFSGKYGNDPSYNKFCEIRDAQDRHTENQAKVYYGDDYEQAISQDIDRRYYAQSQSEQTAHENELPSNQAFNESAKNISEQSNSENAHSFNESMKQTTSEQGSSNSASQNAAAESQSRADAVTQSSGQSK